MDGFYIVTEVDWMTFCISNFYDSVTLQDTLLYCLWNRKCYHYYLCHMEFLCYF